VLLVVCVGAPLLLTLVAVVAVVAIGESASTSPEDDGTTKSDPHTPAERNDRFDPLDAGSDAAPGIPQVRAIDKKDIDRRADFVWKTDHCSDEPLVKGNPELRKNYELAYRNQGTAKRLRGKVAAVHLLLLSPGHSWTVGTSRDAKTAAALTGRFFEAQAKLHGVVDLEYTPMAWTVPTTFVVPDIGVDSQRRVQTPRQLVHDALKATERTLGLTMSSVAASLKKEGFAEVAFFLHLPVETDARDFAYPAPSLSNVDVAVVFHAALDWLGPVVAHEATHLFGADDLYPLDVFDEEDQGDLMRQTCRGFGTLRVRDMSAFAVGWRQDRPKRGYGFQSF